MCALVVIEPAHPQQIVLLIRLQWPVCDLDRIRNYTSDWHSRGRRLLLGFAEGYQPYVLTVLAIELRGICGERSMQGVDDRDRYPVGKRYGSEAAVIMQDVERIAQRCRLLKCSENPRDMVSFIQRLTDLIWVGSWQHLPDRGRRTRARCSEEGDPVT